jgi:hypothetical protein
MRWDFDSFRRQFEDQNTRVSGVLGREMAKRVSGHRPDLASPSHTVK